MLHSSQKVDPSIFLWVWPILLCRFQSHSRSCSLSTVNVIFALPALKLNISICQILDKLKS